MSDFRDHLEQSLADPEFRAEYEALEVQYAFAREVIAARLEKGLTQEALAKLAGTSQANICRVERGSLNPSFEFAQRIASGLGMRLSISLKQSAQNPPR